MADAVVPVAPVVAGGDAPAVDAAPVDAPEVTTEGEAAPAKDAAAEAKRRWKLKTDGIEEDLDEDELLRRASLGGAAYKRMEEAAATKKAMTGLLEALKKDPVNTVLRIAKETGESVDSVKEQMAKLLLSDYEASQLSPEEREIQERQARLEELRAQEKELETKRETEKAEAAAAEQLKRFDVEFAEALKGSGLPKTPRVVARLAELVERDIRLGLGHSAKDLVKVIQREHQGNHKELIGALKGKDLIDFLGPEVIKAVRAYDAEQAKANPAAPRPAARANGVTPKKPAPKPPPMSEKDWRERFGRF